MRFDRQETIRILERQEPAVEVIELGRMVDFFRPPEAVKLLRSQTHILCFGVGNADRIKFITIHVDRNIQAAMNGDLTAKLPRVHGTPQKHPLGWTQQPLRARSGRMGGH